MKAQSGDCPVQLFSVYSTSFKISPEFPGADMPLKLIPTRGGYEGSSLSVDGLEVKEREV